MESSEWEHSKENIQPLRSGRKASTLAKVRLSSRPTKEIQDEKNEYEAALRTYQGTDPLKPWFSYIVWVEQAYPNGGKEGNLPVLLEKCIKEFKDDPINSQDQRYLEVWVKYASMAQKPLDLYNFMHSNNLCTKLPEFYVHWAWELEQVGNYKKAEQAFKAGVEMVDREDPKFESMEVKHRQFQARVMKRMVENSSEQNEASQPTTVEEERSVLGSLQGHGKHQKVGSIRIGPAKKSDQPGALPLTTPVGSFQRAAGHGFAIFQDGENVDPTKASIKATGKNTEINPLPFTKEQNRENELNAGKWTKSSIGKKSHAVPLDRIETTPRFSVHEDEGLQQPAGPTPHKLQPGESNVLSAQKVSNDDDDKDIAVALFEPPDPTKRPMYCKHLVYQGTTEFSFEEIRAAKWRKRREEEQMKQKQDEMNKMMKQMEEEREAMRREQEELKNQQERLRSMQEEALRQQQEVVKQQRDEMMRQQEEFRKQIKHDMEKQMQQMKNSNISSASSNTNSNMQQSASSGALSTELTSQSRETSSNQYQKSSSLLEDTKILLQANPLVSSLPTSSSSMNYGSNPNSLHKTPPRTDAHPLLIAGSNGNQLSQPSPTVNTREAQMLIQEMWGSQSHSEQKSIRDDPKGSKSSSTTAPFTIYQEELEGKNDLPCNNASSKKPSLKVSFPIFCDEPKVEPAMDDAPIVSSRKKVKKPVPIPIFYGDENSQRPNSCQKNKAKPVALTCRPPETTTKPPTPINDGDERDKENVAPAGGNYPAHKIPTNGTLIPSQGVFYAPLEIQEKVLDEDEREQEKAMGIDNAEHILGSADILQQPTNQPNLDQTANPNQTMFLPSAEDFEEMARMASTPFSGRRFVPEEDENTCAIQIAFKTPLPVQPQEIQESSKEMPLPQIQITRSEEENFTRQAEDQSEQCRDSMRETMDRIIGEEFKSQSDVKQDQNSDKQNTNSLSTAEENPIVSQPQAPIMVMSPIMETSREYYRSSSSSSSSSHSQHHITTNKSHWNGNNTTAGPQHRVANNAISGATRTPGSMLLSKSSLSKSKTIAQASGEMTCSSGYMADASSARTPGQFLLQSAQKEYKSCSNKEEDVGLKNKENPPQTLSTKIGRPMPESQIVDQFPSKKVKMNFNFVPHNDGEEEDEPTGFFNGIMSEFQKGAGLISSNNCAQNDLSKLSVQTSQKSKESEVNFLQVSANQTLQHNNTDISRLAGGEATPSRSFLQQSLKASFLSNTNQLNLEELSILNNTNYRNPDFSVLNNSQQPGSTSKLRMPLSGLPIDNFIKPPQLDLTQPMVNRTKGIDMSMGNQEHAQVKETSVLQPPGPVLELTQCSPQLELTQPELQQSVIGQPELDLSNKVDDLSLDRMSNNTSLEELGVNSNPFDPIIHSKLLTYLKVPVASRHGYYEVDSNVPAIRPNNIIQVGPTTFIVKECKGEGGYGKVFRAIRPDDDTNPNETIADMDTVIKVQKPKREWEFYVCTELHHRLPSEKDKQWFMSIPRCYVFNDGSIFVSEHYSFTLLDICNKVGNLGNMIARELLAAYFTIEMLHVLEKLKKARIIHADIKPENFMVQNFPRLNVETKDADEMFSNFKPALILIDFGVSIDMLLLPKDTKFNFKFEKAENLITEMRENKPWTYQIDYFGIASIAHTILYGSYMKLTKKNGKYEPTAKPKRWYNTSLWNSFFHDFINIEECENLPDLVETRKKFECYLFSKYRSQFLSVVGDLSNTLHRK